MIGFINAFFYNYSASLIYPLHKTLGHDPFSISVVLLLLFVLFCIPTAASFEIRLSYNSSTRTPRKTSSSVIKNACLLGRYLALEVLLLRA
jgi:hypothetical protein